MGITELELVVFCCCELLSLLWQSFIRPRINCLQLALMIWMASYLRDSQRQFSVCKYCLEFSFAWGQLKICRWPFRSVTIFDALYLINSVYDFLKFNFPHFTPHARLIFVEKRNLKFSDSKMWWREESRAPKAWLNQGLPRCKPPLHQKPGWSKPG